MIAEEQKEFLLRVARESILSWLENREFGLKQPADAIYEKKMGGFVTLHVNGKLRGCIGYIKGYCSVFETIKDMARSAAFRDPRFLPLGRKELKEINIEISLLSELESVKDIDEIKVGRDGLVIEKEAYSGILLPQVPIEWKWDRDTFLQQVSLKAGLSKNAWNDPQTELFRFQAEIFSEPKKSV